MYAREQSDLRMGQVSRECHDGGKWRERVAKLVKRDDDGIEGVVG